MRGLREARVKCRNQFVSEMPSSEHTRPSSALSEATSVSSRATLALSAATSPRSRDFFRRRAAQKVRPAAFARAGQSRQLDDQRAGRAFRQFVEETLDR